MKPFLISEPWGIQTEWGGSGSILNENSCLKISGSGTPRIIGSKGLVLRYGRGKHKFFPVSSFPFRWEDQVFTAFELPLNPRPKQEKHDFLINVYWNGSKCEVVQSQIVGRPAAEQENELGRKLDGFLEWQINCFRELAKHTADISASDMEEASKSIVRRNWRSVRKIWVGYDRSQAFTELIVEISKKKDRLRLFQSIAQRPRQILQRYRENTPLHRIQEIDSVCIIDLARRPGRTIAEKAGARQKLLAVRRRSHIETLENRVFHWVLKRMLERAHDYLETNKQLIFKKNDKIEAVQKCGRLCNKWVNSDTFKYVTSKHLHHPITPNYTLQMDQRYRSVYQTYRSLLKEEQVRDDAWEWQRTLWKESARQLVGATLTEFFREEQASTPYFRSESDCGIWTQSPVAPGPFITPAGVCVPIDSRDVLAIADNWVRKAPFDFAPYLGRIGCDQVLFWPKRGTILAFWFVYWTGKSDEIGSMLERATESLEILSSDIRRYTRNPYRCLGLMLVTDPMASGEKPGVEIETWPKNSEKPELASLQIPFTIGQMNSEEFGKLIEDFKTGIQLVINTAIES